MNKFVKAINTNSQADLSRALAHYTEGKGEFISGNVTKQLPFLLYSLRKKQGFNLNNNFIYQKVLHINIIF